ncbi:glycine/D-amino acid oxidase-like deaminating enzyme [Sinorhizobium fredii]
MMRRLTIAADVAGVTFVRANATGIDRGVEGIRVSCAAKSFLARHVVIAAGAYSKRFAAQAGDHIPLDTERGYHVEYDMQTPPVSRPVCPVSRGFYLVPMTGRLRVGGTVELGGLEAPINPRRIALLDRGAKALFPHLGPADRQWLGFRSSLPDSIPVIGPSRHGNESSMLSATDIGLTMAPVTARLVQRTLAGRESPEPVAGASPRSRADVSQTRASRQRPRESKPPSSAFRLIGQERREYPVDTSMRSSEQSTGTHGPLWT